ncbi:MAG TPA: hypothetical protein VF284_10835 [Rhodanobacteraceae bacterium]
MNGTTTRDCRVVRRSAIQRPDDLTFSPRKESWVASSHGWFYKIFRASDEPTRDWLDPACSVRAGHEYADMLFLRGISRNVCRPVRLDHACIVYPHLSGPDLRVLLKARPSAAADRRAALRAAITVLAHLHAATARSAGYPAKDYRRNMYVQPSPSIASRIAAQQRVLFIGGFEVRNFRFDRGCGEWFFFDPQHMYMGVPEDDVARFVISLLMINWGRGGALKIWTAFSLDDLLSTYEAASGHTIDVRLLACFLCDTVAMRRFFAMKALCTMRGANRVVGRVYLAAYFRQLEQWVTKHEL